MVPVYAASEKPIEGGTTLDLIQRFDDSWTDKIHYQESLELVFKDVTKILCDGDLFLIIGAGDVVKIVNWFRES